jgi:tRNA A-37 threonylcarbamoyl transferase component Bud32
MPAADVHPAPHDLEAFTLGTLDDASIASHLAGCAACQARAAEAPADELVELLRSAHRHTARGDTPAAAAADTACEERPCPEAPAALADHPRYRLLRPLGTGGMGTVWLAEHRVMGRRVALKVIRPEHLARPGSTERFRREAHAAARLQHPGIVAAHDAEQAGATHFLVMEYVAGVSLAEYLAHTGPLPVAEACRLARDAALALQHAHERGMVHRDVKPHNLMLTPSPLPLSPAAGERGRGEGVCQVKVLDFGLAAFAAGEGPDRGLTAANMVVGTPDYIAPEQAVDAHAADGRSDVYSLGCTLYQMLTGRVPFPGDSTLAKLDAHRGRAPEPVRTLRPEVPARLAAVLAKMMAKRPQDRYQTAADAARALGPYTRPGTGAPPRWPRRALVALAALLLGGALLAAAAAVYRIQTDRGELVIIPESDDVEVVIKQGGRVVTILDTKTDRRVTLRSGTYDLELKDASGWKLEVGRATLKHDGKTLVRIERVAKQPAQTWNVGPKGPTTWKAGEETTNWKVGPARWSLKELPEKPGYVRTLPRLTKKDYPAALSPDGRLCVVPVDLAGGDEIAALRVCETATGRTLRDCQVADEAPAGWLFMPGGVGLLVCSRFGAKNEWTFRGWDLEEGRTWRLGQLEALKGPPVALTRSRDGRRLCALVTDRPGPGSLYVLDLGTGRTLFGVSASQITRAPGATTELTAHLSDDGRWLLTATNYRHRSDGPFDTGRVVILDVDHKGPTRELEVKGTVRHPWLWPAADKLSALHSDGKACRAQTWELATQKAVLALPYGERLQDCGRPLPGGRGVVAVDGAGRLVVFALPAGKELYRSEPLPAYSSWQVSEDGRVALVACKDGFRLYRLPDLPKDKP